MNVKSGRLNERSAEAFKAKSNRPKALQNGKFNNNIQTIDRRFKTIGVNSTSLSRRKNVVSPYGQQKKIGHEEYYRLA